LSSKTLPFESNQNLAKKTLSTTTTSVMKYNNLSLFLSLSLSPSLFLSLAV
jgi:hypothetical protein